MKINILSLVKKDYFLIFLAFALIFWIICPDYFLSASEYDTFQYSQFKSICFRGLIGFPLLILLKIKCESKNILLAIVFAISLSGAIESVLSLMQLLGIIESKHAVFRITGSFYNPGPLGGYLAICDVVAIAYFIKNKLYLSNANKFEKCIFTTFILLISIVLPATFSRTAWIALIISIGYLILSRQEIRNYFKNNLRNVLIISAIILGLITLVFAKKSVSSSGRFLIWKISSIAIAESPISGNGNFEVAYRDASIKYFSQKTYSDSEFRAVDYVNNAFNEYLEIAVRFGVPISLLFIILIVVCFIIGHKHHRNEFCVGLLALTVFSCASYPLHLANFVILLIFCLLGCVLPAENKIFLPIIGLICFVMSIFGYKYYLPKSDDILLLSQPDFFYSNKDYSTAAYYYNKLYPQLSYNELFMYKYGYSLFMNNQTEKAITIFNEIYNKNGNPNICKILGKLYLCKSDFVNAEKYLTQTINILPNRIESYNLLIDMYSRDDYKNEILEKQLKTFIATHKFKDN
ncbi:MAG: O-antigen ligase family protein [Bacteroidales bacterium]|nr:O-antigen ligase family protein [Bacteroidales bacterium]